MAVPNSYLAGAKMLGITSTQMKGLRTLAAALLLSCAAVCAPWAYDVWKDRSHTLITQSETPVFDNRGDDQCTSGTVMATIASGVSLKVQRIRYWKECATVDVKLNDGRTGRIILGYGHVSISPPLN